MNNAIFTAVLSVALLCSAFVISLQRSELAKAREDLAVSLAVNDANAEAMERLERSMANTESVLAGWNEDRTTLADVRADVQQEIKEAMREEPTVDWDSKPVPAPAWRVLGKAVDARQDGDGVTGTALGFADGLFRNADSEKRNQW